MRLAIQLTGLTSNPGTLISHTGALTAGAKPSTPHMSMELDEKTLAVSSTEIDRRSDKTT